MQKTAPVVSATLDAAAVPPWPARRVHTGGVELSVVDEGPLRPAAGRRTLLLLHGAQGNWSHWRANVDELARGGRVVVPDMPGFGLSEAAPAGDLDALAGTLADLVDRLGLHAVALVGYSFGSLVAVRLVALRPDAIERLLIINPPGWRERSPEMVDLQARAAARSKEAGVRAGVDFTLREIMLRNHAHIDQACLDQTEAAVRRFRMRTKDISRSVDLFELLGEVRIPWHVMFSAEDPYHRYRLQARCARLEAFKGAACTTVVRAARHWVQQDRPETFNQLIAEFASGDAALPATA